MVYQRLMIIEQHYMFLPALECLPWHAMLLEKSFRQPVYIYMTIANLGRIVGAYLIGPFKNMFSWEYTLFAFAIMMLCALLVVRSIRIDSHVERVKDLEKKDLESQLAVVVG
jgi:predicted MFS family arabinose efflux permease